MLEDEDHDDETPDADAVWERWARNLGFPFTDRLGREVTFKEWAALAEDPSYAIVGRVRLPRMLISTVWIGRVMPPEGGSFETMIFERRKRDGNAPWAHLSFRWDTLEEAASGHRWVVRMIKTGHVPNYTRGGFSFGEITPHRRKATRDRTHVWRPIHG